MIVLIAGFMLIEPLKNNITVARADLVCTGADLTNGEMLSCLLIDGIVPYLIVVIISVSVGWVGRYI